MKRDNVDVTEWVAPRGFFQGSTFEDSVPYREPEEPPILGLTARGLAFAVFIVFAAVVLSHFFPLGFAALELP